jgi:hypothetical protein
VLSNKVGTLDGKTTVVVTAGTAGVVVVELCVVVVWTVGSVPQPLSNRAQNTRGMATRKADSIGLVMNLVPLSVIAAG